MPFVSLADVKTLLDITGTEEDSKLSLMIQMVDRNIKEYCRRTFEQASYTEFYSGTGSAVLVLRQRPVQSITNIWLDNQGFFGDGTASPFSSTTLLTSGVDYSLARDETLSDGTVVSRSGLAVRTNTIWPELNPGYFPGRLTQEYGPAKGNIKVQYVAGYPAAAVPADLRMAFIQLLAAFRRNLPFGGAFLSSESISDYNYSLSDTNQTMPPIIGSVRQILNRYREISFGEPALAGPGSYGR